MRKASLLALMLIILATASGARDTTLTIEGARNVDILSEDKVVGTIELPPGPVKIQGNNATIQGKSRELRITGNVTLTVFQNEKPLMRIKAHSLAIPSREDPKP